MKPQIHTMAEVLAFLNQPWKVEKTLPSQGIAVIYGPENFNKTQFAVYLGLAISTGSDWFDKKTNKTDVMYCALNGLVNCQEAILNWNKTHEELPSSINFYADFLNLSDFIDRNRNSPYYDLLERVTDNSVLIIDDLFKVAPFIDNTKSSGMSKIIEALNQFVIKKNCLVVLLHDALNSGDHGLKGHSSLSFRADSIIKIKVNSKNQQITWELEKSRDS